MCFETVQIYGYNLNLSPPASQVVSLLNLQLLFKKHGREEEGAETEIIMGLCLMNARRYL